MRLSAAGIPTLLLVGNHDISPATGRAHTLQEFSTLQVPHVTVIDKPCFLHPKELEGLPLQVIGLPWVFRSNLMASLELSGEDPDRINREIEDRISDILNQWLEELDPMLARRAGARLQTLVIDEGFGSQDAEGRQHLIEAINSVRGNFAKILVITHMFFPTK